MPPEFGQGRLLPRPDLLVIVVIVEVWSHHVRERRRLDALVIAFGLAALPDNV